MAPDRAGLVLITGATGYVGGRLLHALERDGRRLRCLARRPDQLMGRAAPTTEIVRGDLLDAASLGPALAGVHTAFYLAHSMGLGERFIEEDRRAAGHFAAAAREAGVARIVYLGGLGRGADLSPHLASRQEVGAILAASGVQTLEFRASIVIGSGSLSFEMVRALVEKLPVMIAPRWVRVLAQPIAIEDLVAYLRAGLDAPVAGSRIFEIGGADPVTYGDLMQEYARQRRLRRMIIPVPVLTPRLSSLWLGLVTPLYARVGRILIESMPHETVVEDDEAERLFRVRPRGAREAIERAIHNEDQQFAETRWTDALSSVGARGDRAAGRFGNRIVDSRRVEIAASPERAFRAVERIGGGTGWYYANTLWRVRGLFDLLAGGVGMRRGRRDPERLAPGDVVDCWRVEQIERGKMLRLRAEMIVPGRAWLQFEVEPTARGSAVRQTALFDPRGLVGLSYWWLLYLIHEFVFRGMLRGLARAAAADERSPSAR